MKRHLIFTTALCATFVLSGFSATRSDGLSSNFSAYPTVSAAHKRASVSDVFHALGHDLKYFYAPRPIFTFAGVLTTAAVMANTSVDKNVAKWYQTDVRSSSTDKLARAFKWQGQDWPMITDGVLTFAGYVANQDMTGGVFGWASRNLQAIFLGAPVLGATQMILGGGRPCLNQSSHWRFFGVGPAASGHSFYGAIPWLTAAQMVHNKPVKASLYALSTLTAFSRINDNKHYLSQTMLGWTIAYLATHAVSESKSHLAQQVQVTPIVSPHMVGAGMTVSYSG